jgi:hypothetical protein
VLSKFRSLTNSTLSLNDTDVSICLTIPRYIIEKIDIINKGSITFSFSLIFTEKIKQARNIITDVIKGSLSPEINIRKLNIIKTVKKTGFNPLIKSLKLKALLLSLKLIDL